VDCTQTQVGTTQCGHRWTASFSAPHLLPCFGFFVWLGKKYSPGGNPLRTSLTNQTCMVQSKELGPRRCSLCSNAAGNTMAAPLQIHWQHLPTRRPIFLSESSRVEVSKQFTHDELKVKRAKEKILPPWLPPKNEMQLQYGTNKQRKVSQSSQYIRSNAFA
jgi:hypothetical protein